MGVYRQWAALASEENIASPEQENKRRRPR